MASKWPFRPKTSHYRSPVCSSHVLTPHNASMNDPEAGLGLHQLGGWHCQCNFGLRMAFPPQTSHFRSPVCSSHVLTPHNASMNDPEAGLGLHQLGGRAQQWLAWKLKVGRSRSQTTKLRSNSFCTVAPSLYGWDRTFQTDCTSTVLYGANTVRTV